MRSQESPAHELQEALRVLSSRSLRVIVVTLGVAWTSFATAQPRHVAARPQTIAAPSRVSRAALQETAVDNETGVEKETASDPRATFTFGGRVQTDYTMFTESEPFEGVFGTVENGGEFRRLRVHGRGHLGRIEYKAQLDFAGQEVNPKDLYVGLRGLAVTVRAGYQYEPWSLEQQTSSRYMTFMERSLAVAFSPDRNLGLRVIKNYDDKAQWSVGVFRETGGWETKPGKHYNFTWRGTYAPVLSEDRRRLLHFGINYIHKFVDGELTFKLRPDAHAAPSVVNLTVPASSADYVQLEVSTNLGSFAVQGEYVHGWVQSGERKDPRVWAAYGQVSFFLTGENRPYTGSAFGRVTPKRPLFDGGPGAIEIKARHAFADFSAATESGGGQLVAFTAGVNWYWTSYLRVMAEFSRSNLLDRDVSATSIWNFRFAADW